MVGDSYQGNHRIAGKFGGNDVLQKWMDEDFGEKKFGEWIGQKVINCNYSFG